MSNYKSGHENITYIKANASIDLSSASSVTANGIRGLISMTVDSTWANGYPKEFTLNNTFIQADSLVNLCICTNGGTAWIPIIRTAYNMAAGSCKIALINATGGGISATSVVHIAYEVVN
jgi:hypothetical protein